MLEAITTFGPIITSVITGLATVVLVIITGRYVKLTKDILETHNEPRIKITIEPHIFAHTITESIDDWNTGKLEANLYTIAIENIGTGTAKEIKIKKDPFPGLKLNEVLQKSKMYPKQRYELITSKATIEKKAANGFIEYEISYKNSTDKEIKDSFKISTTTINLTPTAEDEMEYISRSILAIAKKYTGRNIQQEIKKASEAVANEIDNNKD